MKKTTPSSRKKHLPPTQSYGGKGERRKQLITMIKEIIKMMLTPPTPPHTIQTTSAIRMEDNKTIEKDSATKLRQRKMTFLPVDVPRIQDNIRMFQMLSRGGVPLWKVVLCGT